MRRARRLWLLAILVSLVNIGTPRAWAEGGGDELTGKALDGNGTYVGARAEIVGFLSQGKNLDGTAVTTPYEYATRLACQKGVIGDVNAADAGACTKASQGCQGNTAVQGIGLLYEVYRRPLNANGPWEFIATTCFGDQVPGTSPVVTMPMIIEAFRKTPWAKTVITTEPKGDVTLVGLDTYYQVSWSTAGYQPGEVDPVTMLGFQVEIRPRLDHFTYHFGDGQDFGPTSNEGGVYPGGGITHQYLKGGAYPANVDTTFGADFRINGGDWAPIPDTVTVPGPATPVTVKTARAQLVSN